MARKANILPIIAIGGIVGAAFFLGGKKKKARGATRPAEPATPTGPNGQNGEPPAPPSPVPVAPGEKQCPEGYVLYRVVPDPGATYRIGECVPVDMLEAMIGVYGEGVEISSADIAAWKAGDRSMLNAGKEAGETGMGTGAPLSPPQIQPTLPMPPNLAEVDGSVMDLSAEDQQALMGRTIAIVSDEDGQWDMMAVMSAAYDHPDITFVLLDAQANAPVPPGSVLANVDLEVAGEYTNWLDDGDQALLAAIEMLPAPPATRTLSPGKPSQANLDAGG